MIGIRLLDAGFVARPLRGNGGSAAGAFASLGGDSGFVRAVEPRVARFLRHRRVQVTTFLKPWFGAAFAPNESRITNHESRLHP
jgi:hypothetical protein